MAKLRAYSRNGGDMLKLVRYQKRHVDREVMQDKPLTIKDLVGMGEWHTEEQAVSMRIDCNIA